MLEQYTYLAGPSVCGFYGAFETDFGEPSTPRPYPRVTPSRAGSALLPFNCPHCNSVVDFSDPERREAHHDTREAANGKRRDNYWCPTCNQRFCLNLKGKMLEGHYNGEAAPSEVETIAVGDDGMVDYRRSIKYPFSKLFRTYLAGTDVLGSCC